MSAIFDRPSMWQRSRPLWTGFDGPLAITAVRGDLLVAADGIAEDFALADDLVKPLLAARPNDPEALCV